MERDFLLSVLYEVQQMKARMDSLEITTNDSLKNIRKNQVRDELVLFELERIVKSKIVNAEETGRCDNQTAMIALENIKVQKKNSTS